MTAKAYKDRYGNYLCSDDVLFDEYTEEFTYNDWLLSPEEYYKQILKENKYIYDQLVKELQN